MIRVPVTVGFNKDRVIGWLELEDVEAERMLASNPLYHFALGGVVKDSQVEPSEAGTLLRKITEFQLTEVSLIPDSQFYAPKEEDEQ